MGMGRATQNTNMSGMPGKGGAARPNPVQQPVQGMGGKGVGQQPMQSQQAQQSGMGGKGQLSGGQPLQQSNLNNALSGLAGAPTQTYPFPQPPAQQQQQQQPTAGMGGKGLGQQQTDPRMQQALQMMQAQQQAQQSGMGGKGVGQQQTVNPATVFPGPQGQQRNQAYLNSNQQQTPQAFNTQAQQALEAMQSQMRGQPASQQEQDLMAQQAYNAMQAQRQMQQPATVQPAPVEPPPIMGVRTAYNAATGQNLQPTPPSLMEQAMQQNQMRAQPATGMGSKGALRSAAKTPQVVQPERLDVATQRRLQQISNRGRTRGIR